MPLIRVIRPSHISYTLEPSMHRYRPRSYPAYQKQQAVETGDAPEMEQPTCKSATCRCSYLHVSMNSFHMDSYTGHSIEILAIIVATRCIVSH